MHPLLVYEVKEVSRRLMAVAFSTSYSNLRKIDLGGGRLSLTCEWRCQEIGKRKKETE
jgi:hypothetical protein